MEITSIFELVCVAHIGLLQQAITTPVMMSLEHSESS